MDGAITDGAIIEATAVSRDLIPELIPRAVRTIEKALAGIDPVEATTAKKVLSHMFDNLG